MWIAEYLELPHVPILHNGLWSQEIQDKYTFKNFIEGTKVPHEGIVIKDLSGKRNKVAKVINPDYQFMEKNMTLEIVIKIKKGIGSASSLLYI